VRAGKNGSQTVLGRGLQKLRLWGHELRLKFELRSSRHFKRDLERKGCLNLARLEEQYLDEIQSQLADLQKNRNVLKRGVERSK
jgi:hypothetical protein